MITRIARLESPIAARAMTRINGGIGAATADLEL
jgi:hypothetical protein